MADKTVKELEVTQRHILGDCVYGKGVYPDVPVERANKLIGAGVARILGTKPVEAPAPLAPAKTTAPAVTKPKGKKLETKPEIKPVTPPTPGPGIVAAALQQEGQDRAQAAFQAGQQSMAAGNDQPPAVDAEANLEGLEEDAQELPEEVMERLTSLSGPLPDGLPGKAVYEAAGIVKVEDLITLDETTLAGLPGSTPELVAEGQQWLIEFVSK